jgi:hypothetical protein
MKHSKAVLLLIFLSVSGAAQQASAAGGIDPTVLNLMSDGSRLKAMSDGAQPKRLAEQTRSMLLPIEQFSRLVLHFYPERLDAPGKAAFGHGNADTSTAEFANALFRDEWIAETRATRDVIARRDLEQRWYKRLKNMDPNPRTTIRTFWPVTLWPARYDFAAETFPVYGNNGFSIKNLPAAGFQRGNNCIQLDRSFELPSVKVPKGEADAFVARNRNTLAKGSSAAIFVSMQVTITGRNELSKNDYRGCPLTARVDFIRGYDYVGLDRFHYGVQGANPGAQFTSWYERDENAAGGAAASEVATPFHAQETPTAAAEEAHQFGLPTKFGLVVVGTGGTPTGKDTVNDPQARKNLETYTDFLFMGAAPELFTPPARAACVGGRYLPEDQRKRFFQNTSVGQGRWLGDDVFEKKRMQQAFVATGLPQLMKRSVSPPRRFLVVSEMRLPPYDFQNNGFPIGRLNTNAMFSLLRGPCSPDILHLGSGDHLETFWKVPPAQAEAIILGLPSSQSARDSGARRVYLATEIELNMLPAIERIPGDLYSSNVPVISRLLTSTLYADPELSQKLFSPKIYKTRPSVLEVGLPSSVTISESYDVDYGVAPDFLRLLRSKGDLSANEWVRLSEQQSIRDKAYNTMVLSQRPKPGAPPSFDEDYTPFFPWRFTANAGSYNGLTDEQRLLFKKWSRMQAAALP